MEKEVLLYYMINTMKGSLPLSGEKNCGLRETKPADREEEGYGMEFGF